MGALNQPDNQDNWPNAVRSFEELENEAVQQLKDITEEVFSTRYEPRTALLEAVEAQKASDMLPDISAFNAGLNAWYEEETAKELSQYTDKEIKAEYDKRFPF